MLEYDTKALLSTLQQMSNYPHQVVLAGFILHTAIALLVFFHTRADFQLLQQLPSRTHDIMMQLIYIIVIDATVAVFTVSRSGVRIWHWKVNTAVVAPCLIYFYASPEQMPYYALMFVATMIFAYIRLQKEGDVFPVGLSKYIKGEGDSDYFDLTVDRNAKYLLIGAVEAMCIYHHKVNYFSPLLFVLADAVWNRATNEPRTKLSDLYVSIFTASMDTGMWMGLFDTPASPDIVQDLCVLAAYMILVRILVYVNGKQVQRTHEIMDSKYRYAALISFVLVARLCGQYKHNFAVYAANITANMLFVWMSAQGWGSTPKSAELTK